MKEIIENLYKVFQKYSIQDIFYCDCGCIDKADVISLASKSLRNLEADDLASYHGSALYTWGNLDHYKHYLPRFFEIYAEDRNTYVGLFEISQKFTHENWKTWSKLEIEAIEFFILADWKRYIESENGLIMDTILGYSFYIDLDVLMLEFNKFDNDKLFKNFVQFLYWEGNEVLYKKYTLKSNKEGYLLELFNKEQLISKLEATFFEVESVQVDYAEKLSFVLNMIENIKL